MKKSRLPLKLLPSVTEQMDMWHQNGNAACGSGHWKGENLGTERKIKTLVFKGVIFEIPKGEKSS